MRRITKHWFLASLLAIGLLAAPMVLALPPGPGGGSCEYCAGHLPNRYCNTTSAGGYNKCETDTFGNCIATSPCGSSLTITP